MGWLINMHPVSIRFGFDRYKEPAERVGWLISMHPVSIRFGFDRLTGTRNRQRELDG